MILGKTTANTGENNYDITVDNNIFDQGGTGVGQIRAGNNDVMKITNNIFRDPYYGLGADNVGIHLYGTGATTTSSYVTISGNPFTLFPHHILPPNPNFSGG